MKIKAINLKNNKETQNEKMKIMKKRKIKKKKKLKIVIEMHNLKILIFKAYYHFEDFSDNARFLGYTPVHISFLTEKYHTQI